MNQRLRNLTHWTTITKSTSKLLIVFFLSIVFHNQATATTYTLTTAGAANAQTAGNWNTGGTGGGGAAASNFTNAADVFIIASGTAAVFATTTSTTIAGTLQVDGSFTIGSGANSATTTVTVNGTVTFS